MRARPREINIFNMSLLDILCGALGAFCFMMLVALPYYVVGKVDRAKSQERTDELIKDIEKLREGMSDPAQAEDLRKLVEELEAQIKQLQGELNQYAYENDQLHAEKLVLTNENDRLSNENAAVRSENSRLTSDNNALKGENTRLTAENDQLTKENQQTKARLAARKPFVVMAGCTDITQELAIFLEDVDVSGETDKTKLANAHFDPRSPMQPSNWQHDITNFRVDRRGATLWVSSTTPWKSSYRVFVKYNRPPPEGNFPFSDSYLRPTPVAITFYGDFAEEKRHFATNLTPQRFWSLVGTLNVDDQGKLAFKEATEAERDEAWREFMKSDVPASAPTATPLPALDREEIERLRRESQEERRRYEEERLRRQGGQPDASPAFTPLSDEGRARRDRFLRERLASPTPAATP